LTKSLRTHGTNRGAFYSDKIAWPVELSEESLAVFLLRYFLAPLSDQLDDQILLQFHLASQYFERLRSGKEKLKPHVSEFTNITESGFPVEYMNCFPKKRQYQKNGMKSYLVP